MELNRGYVQIMRGDERSGSSSLPVLSDLRELGNPKGFGTRNINPN
jgi:hypothetical protein